ncbi:hypothetical protein ACIQVO_35960 [Streptomyces sp. NPDC101062]|uniref:hypothetical protein n=1 Tax=unclassified Streptomyces TaxID=2593676 RepID=UPI00382FA2E5
MQTPLTQHEAMRLLIASYASMLNSNPHPVAFWLATTGPRSGQIIWGDPFARSGHRPDDDPFEREVPEPLMNWEDFIHHVRTGNTAEHINDDLQQRAAHMRARWGM